MSHESIKAIASAYTNMLLEQDLRGIENYDDYWTIKNFIDYNKPDGVRMETRRDAGQRLATFMFKMIGFDSQIETLENMKKAIERYSRRGSVEIDDSRSGYYKLIVKWDSVDPKLANVDTDRI